MDLTFDLGDSRTPKGHALVYFQVDTEPDKTYATYVVILPVQADLGKYVPPFLASHLGNLPLSDFSAFAMPPVPEEVASYQELQRLSRMRDDDLIYAGSMFSFDLPRMMESTTEAVQAYSQLCSYYFEPGKSLGTEAAEPSLEAEPGRTPQDDGGSLQVNEVLFSLMSQNDKLGELSRLLGKLQFAQQGQDSSMVASYQELQRLSRMRDDDLIYAGSMFSFDLPRMMESTTEAVQAYSQLCSYYFEPGKSLGTEAAEPSLEAEPGRTPQDDGGSLQVNEVLFSLMSQNDKLGELSRLLGKLQFAQQGQDSSMVGEVTEEITALARHLPEDFQVSRLLAAAQETTARGSRLAQLYLDRCFRLCAGDASSARELEDEIHALRDQD